VEEVDGGMNAILEQQEVPIEGAASAAIGFDEAIRFIWSEADMLDRHEYHSWLALWDTAGQYIVPLECEERLDYADHLNVVFDDEAMRHARVKRLLSGFSMSAAPPARTVRSLSRFVQVRTQTPGIALRCAQILTEYKYGRQRVLAADVDFHVIRAGGELRLSRKVVRLVNADDALHGIGYLL
jgi:3-phenylpropionate/cinnamic acid dioxygenase small subunit